MTKQHIFIVENNLQKVGQSFFHLSRQTTMIYLSDVSFHWYRTNVNVKACQVQFKIQIEWLTSVLLVYTIANGLDVFLKYMGIFTFHILTHLQLETV